MALSNSKAILAHTKHYPMPQKDQKWYQQWFNSPYYHILYKHRDDTEAEQFIDNLCAFLEPHAHAKALDVACGRGRHAIYLNKKGLDVVGIDLSPENIKYATQFENEHLTFFVHDMRNLFYINYFDFAFNLFTSFGYFDSATDDLHTVRMFAGSLKKGGKLVLDFLNVKKAESNLVERESKEVQNIEFHIIRRLKDDKVLKEIKFEHRGYHFNFREEVRALTKKEFEKYFATAGLKIVHLFGNYELGPFDEAQSDRLIFVCEKI